MYDDFVINLLPEQSEKLFEAKLKTVLTSLA